MEAASSSKAPIIVRRYPNISVMRPLANNPMTEPTTEKLPSADCHVIVTWYSSGNTSTPYAFWN